MSYAAELLLLLFSINIGIAFGAGLYELRIIMPLWFEKVGTIYLVNTAMMRQLDVGRRFWGFVTTAPLTLLTLANLLMAWQMVGPQRDWWLAAAFTTLAERVGTFAFFIPTAIRLERSNLLSAAVVSGLARRWILANYGRIMLNLTGWLLALKALTTCI